MLFQGGAAHEIPVAALTIYMRICVRCDSYRGVVGGGKRIVR